MHVHAALAVHALEELVRVRRGTLALRHLRVEEPAQLAAEVVARAVGRLPQRDPAGVATAPRRGGRHQRPEPHPQPRHAAGRRALETFPGRAQRVLHQPLEGHVGEVPGRVAVPAGVVVEGRHPGLGRRARRLHLAAIHRELLHPQAVAHHQQRRPRPGRSRRIVDGVERAPRALEEQRGFGGGVQGRSGRGGGQCRGILPIGRHRRPIRARRFPEA